MIIKDMVLASLNYIAVKINDDGLTQCQKVPDEILHFDIEAAVNTKVYSINDVFGNADVTDKN